MRYGEWGSDTVKVLMIESRTQVAHLLQNFGPHILADLLEEVVGVIGGDHAKMIPHAGGAMPLHGTVEGTLSMKTNAKIAKPKTRPTSVNGTVPPARRRNADRRPREYLTAKEVEPLIATDRKSVV